MPTHYDMNHPKSYIGYAVALAYSTHTVDETVTEYVTNGVSMARRGAQNLGLVVDTDDGYELTDQGVWVAQNAPDWFEADSLAGVLETFDDMRGARKRFVDAFPAFSEVGPKVAYGDETLARLINLMQRCHEQRFEYGFKYAMSTPQLVRRCWSKWPDSRPFIGKTFFRDDEQVRKYILGSTDPEDWRDTPLRKLDLGALLTNQQTSRDIKPVYRSATTYQLKNLGWHLGVFQWKGTQAKHLDPEELTWALEKPLLQSTRTESPAASEAIEAEF